MPTFSNRLKELRIEKGATQKNMAELLGITERNYQRYEYGLVDPTASNATKLADYFDVSVDYLLGRVNYLLDAEGHITVKVPPDIFSDEEKKKFIKE